MVTLLSPLQVCSTLQVYGDGSIQLLNPPVDRPTFWRVKHDIEMGSVWRRGLPEVHPLFANHHSEFQAWAQKVSFGLNPWFTPELWTKAYDYEYWMTNHQGFGDGTDPRANFITGENLTKELPRVEALVCGGSMIEGVRVGDWVKVKGLHFNTPVTLEYLKLHPQYWVRAVYAGGTGQPFRMLGDKYDGPAFIHPLIVNQDYDCFIQYYKLQEASRPDLPVSSVRGGCSSVPAGQGYL
jgi:hypothetical protein